MSLRIDVPSRKYTANAPVSGTVTLVGEEDVGVARISITFSGRCKSKIVDSQGNSETTYRTRVPLFTYTVGLFKGPYTLHPNEHSWPFSFRFPAQCETRGGNGFREQQPQSSFGGLSLARRFNNDPHQELPRSIMPFENGWNTRRSGYVSYQLEAILVRDGTKVFASHTTSTTKLLHLGKPRKEAEPSPQMLRLLRPLARYSMHLLPGYEERSLTFKERLSSMRSKNVPCANFSVVLQLPKVGVLGQTLPLLLNIEHDPEKSNCLAPPTIFLKSVSVRLQTNSSVRCMKDSPWQSRTSEITEDWDEEVVIAVLHKATPMPIPDHTALPIDLRDQMFLTLRESSAFPGLVPSYSTFNLAVQYWLRVRVSVECGQKSFKPEFLSRNFELLASEWVGHHENVPVSSVERDGSASDPPPPYARDPELCNPSGVKA